MKNSHQVVRHRNHSRRVFGWIVIYLLIFGAFLAVTYRQSIKVNTLDFPSGQIQLVVSKTQYTVGDTITYTIKNGLTNSITLVNNCPQEPLHIYQWINSSWVRIHDTANVSVCTNQPRQLDIAAGGTITKDLSAWPNLFSKPGIYRLVAFADNYANIPYVDFQVVASAQPIPVSTPQVIYKTIIQRVLVPAPNNDN